jgi:hypothetical protein
MFLLWLRRTSTGESPTRAPAYTFQAVAITGSSAHISLKYIYLLQMVLKILHQHVFFINLLENFNQKCSKHFVCILSFGNILILNLLDNSSNVSKRHFKGTSRIYSLPDKHEHLKPTDTLSFQKAFRKCGSYEIICKTQTIRITTNCIFSGKTRNSKIVFLLAVPRRPQSGFSPRQSAFFYTRTTVALVDPPWLI